MMTAQNKQTPTDSGSNAGPTPAIGGFGKVLNSIQGLQQRLGDFSIEDVTRAEANANTLIRRLVQLQNTLARLADLKRSLADTAAMMDLIPEPDYDLIGPAGLEKHPQLHAIVKASKVIRLHRLLKIAKASAEAVSFDAEAGRLDVTSPLAPATTPPKAQKYPKPVDKQQPEPKADKQATVRQAGKDSAAEVIELPPPPADGLPSETPMNPASKEPAPPAVTENASSLSSSEPEQTHSAYAKFSTPIMPTDAAEETPATFSAAATDPIDDTPAGETKTETHPAEAVVQPAIPALERKQDRQAPPAAQSFVAPSSATTVKTAHEFDDERAAASVDSTFDQRLLDELIQNYGEFAPFAKAAKTRPQASAPRADTAAPRVEPSAPRVETFSPSVETALPPEPRFVAAEPVTTVEATAVETETVEVSLPMRSRGDLDRQLKKIIKDYGEYDLYSHTSQSSITLKRSGIAAFIVLGLVLSGVYFLRSPVKTTPPQVDSVLPSSPQSLPAVPQAAKENSAASASDGGAAKDLNKKAGGNEKTPNAVKTKTPQKQ